MYLSLRNRPTGDERPSTQTRRRVSGTVVALGIVSMVTDISTESVNAVLPNYLIIVVGLSPQAFGAVNGLYNGVSSLVRILGGWAADRTDRPKWVAFFGYFVSALSKVALLSAHSFGAFSSVATADQLGKGLRTAPRDGMIAASTPPEALGRAFGVHRSLDTLGAFIGPLLAFWILSVVPNDFHSVFVTAVAFAMVGVAVLLLIVPDVRSRRPVSSTALAADTAVTAVTVKVERVSLRQLANPQMARLLTAAGLLGLLSVGEVYVFLELQDRDNLALKYYPLLVVGMNLAYLGLAIPFGLLADRYGRWRVFVGGYIALLVAYLSAGGPARGMVATVGCLFLLGAYYAATDGVLAAMAGRVTNRAVRTSAIAAAQTVLAAAAFGSSIGFAVLWSQIGRANALLAVAVALAVILPVAGMLLKAADVATGTPIRDEASHR